MLAASSALGQVVWTGDPRAGNAPEEGPPDGTAPTDALARAALTDEALLARHPGAAPAEATVAHDDLLWFF